MSSGREQTCWPLLVFIQDGYYNLDAGVRSGATNWLDKVMTEEVTFKVVDYNGAPQVQTRTGMSGRTLASTRMIIRTRRYYGKLKV